jgi:hypothetical protein
MLIILKYYGCSESRYMACKDICFRHRAPRPIGTGRYFSGQKRCQVCNMFIIWDELWCPCCGFRLRLKPNSLGKQKLVRMRTKYQQEIKN